MAIIQIPASIPAADSRLFYSFELMDNLIKTIRQRTLCPVRFYRQTGLLLAACLTIVACSSNRPVGQGVVLKEQLVSLPDRTAETKTGAWSGAAVGSVLGALGGAAAGTACTLATLGLCAPMVPGYVLGGAAVGGGVGTASGAAIGYGVGSYQQGKGLYNYEVQPCSAHSGIISLQQQSAVYLPVGTRVLIYQTNHAGQPDYRIQKVRKKDEKTYPEADCSLAAGREMPAAASDSSIPADEASCPDCRP
ncbi:MAG: hypothetical protein ACR2PT_12150 [Endozoicomonas sp.]